jgi:putative flippase GtrA
MTLSEIPMSDARVPSSTTTVSAAPNNTLAPNVDIVLPVHNEARVIEANVRALHRYLSGGFPFSWRITIVDNASTDGTWIAATSLSQTLTGVRSIHLDEKGRGRALRRAWTDNDAAVVAYMDIDLSTGLDALLPLVAPLVSGHSDVAIGSRLAAGAQVARGPRREFISRCYNALLRITFGNGFRDAQCGFKAVRSGVARYLLPQVEDNEWFFDTELLLLAERNGLRVHEVPVTWIDDPDSRVRVIRTAAGDLRGVARVARRFWSGRGKIELGDVARPVLDDDFGRQVVTFAKVGVLSTGVSLLLFLLWRDAVGAVWANLLAVGATAIANTWANRRYTFGYRDRQRRGRHYLGSVAISMVGLALSSVALANVTGNLAQILVLLLSWGLVTVARFGLLRRWVFQP